MHIKRAALAALLPVLLLAGCGGGHAKVSSPHAATCDPPIGQGRMGGCVQRHYRFTRGQAALGGVQGLDVSNYQGFPSWPSFARAGIRFVWNQTSDGPYFRDGNFLSNYCAERRAGILPGAYHFLRAGYVTPQVESMVALIRTARARCPGSELPPLIDAELPGAYANVAPFAAALRARGFGDTATYASPGLWDGSSDGGTLLDVASWGIQGSAFSWWAAKGGAGNYVAQQWCGAGCYVAGLEVDRQVDHGVLARVKSPESDAQRRARLRRELRAHEAAIPPIRVRIRTLHVALERYGCRRRERQHQPRGPRCLRWARQGRAKHRQGNHEHAEVARLRALV